MPLHINIQKTVFWVNVFKIALPFFIIVSLFAIVFHTGSYLFSGQWDKVIDYHFSGNRWMRFLLQKSVICILYGMFMANKNMK